MREQAAGAQGWFTGTEQGEASLSESIGGQLAGLHC